MIPTVKLQIQNMVLHCISKVSHNKFVQEHIMKEEKGKGEGA